jgi:hypothetical protein
VTAIVLTDANADYVEFIETLADDEVIVIECQLCDANDTRDEVIDELLIKIGTSVERATSAYQRYALLSVKTDCESCHDRYQNAAMAFDFHRQLLELRSGGDLGEIKRCAEQRWTHFARMGYQPASSRCSR